MKVHTTRFGVIDVDEASVIEFPEGIIGFKQETLYVMMDHSKGPYRWLQAVTEPGLAFVIINPSLIVENYYIHLRDEDLTVLGFADSAAMKEDLAVAVILNFSGLEPSANLLAPLVFNAEKRFGCQVVLHSSGYSTRHKLSLTPKKEPAKIQSKADKREVSATP